jgi:hypothetical protein
MAKKKSIAEGDKLTKSDLKAFKEGLLTQRDLWLLRGNYKVLKS